MFQFPPFASQIYFTQLGIIGRYAYRVSPFRNFRVNARLAAHRNLSWPTPSFFASMSQGIHLVPWVAYRFVSDFSFQATPVGFSRRIRLECPPELSNCCHGKRPWPEQRTLRLFADLWKKPKLSPPLFSCLGLHFSTYVSKLHQNLLLSNSEFFTDCFDWFLDVFLGFAFGMIFNLRSTESLQLQLANALKNPKDFSPQTDQTHFLRFKVSISRSNLKSIRCNLRFLRYGSRHNQIQRCLIHLFSICLYYSFAWKNVAG